MDIKNRQQAISKILMRAWRERWTNYQFGIEIKEAFPIKLGSDAILITDVILQQTLIGAGVNKLLLSYLKHSLFSEFINYPTVIKRITHYKNFDKSYCVKALLDFLISIINGVTGQHRLETADLMDALLSLVYWLIEMTEKLLTKILESSNSTKGLSQIILLRRSQRILLLIKFSYIYRTRAMP